MAIPSESNLDDTADDLVGGLAPRGRIPKSGAVAEVYNSILLKIVRGELPAGTELKTTRLARELEVSRMPVREALLFLAADGLVLLNPNSRAVVRPGAQRWLESIHDLREMLEPRAAELAATRISQQTLETLRELAEAAKPNAAGDWREAAIQFDHALHLAVAAASGNPALEDAIRRCIDFKQISYLAVPENLDLLKSAYQQHLQLLAALSAQDPHQAAATMYWHLRSLRTGGVSPERSGQPTR